MSKKLRALVWLLFVASALSLSAPGAQIPRAAMTEISPEIRYAPSAGETVTKLLCGLYGATHLAFRPDDKNRFLRAQRLLYARL